MVAEVSSSENMELANMVLTMPTIKVNAVIHMTYRGMENMDAQETRMHTIGAVVVIHIASEMENVMLKPVMICGVQHTEHENDTHSTVVDMVIEMLAKMEMLKRVFQEESTAQHMLDISHGQNVQLVRNNK